jgi:hypothetical protein
MYDFDQDALRNYIIDAIVIDNQIITQSIQFCVEDTSYEVCGIMAKFDLKGDLLIVNVNYQSAAFYDGPDCLQHNGSFIYYSTNHKIDNYENTYLYKYDLDLNKSMLLSYSGANTNSNTDNKGIRIVEDNVYIFGDVSNMSGVPDSFQIIKTDLLGNELWRRYFSYGNSGLDINNLQSTPDGDLAFILQISSPNGANKGFDGYQLMRIDTSGMVLDSFVFEDVNSQPNRLLVTSDGGFVFSSIDHPFDGHDIFTTGYGLINKLDSEMDTLEWSLILPNDQLVDGRHYRMYDYIEAYNGDIVACGMAFDNSDTELATGVPDKNSTWNGFITRLSPEGEIVWLRLYKNPNDLVPQDEYGRFRPSILNKIHELPDGRFVAVGDVFVNNSQISAINEQETEAFHLWLLMLDENGCLDGYDCDEIIRIIPKRNINYNVGDQWIYETEEYIGGGNGFIDFRLFAVQDTLYDGMHTKYILGALDTFYVENNRMFFWDEYYQEYIMYYDWDATTSYEIKYADQISGTEAIATVVIDSISYRQFGNDSLKMQHVHIDNSGTFENYFDVVYEGVGAGSYGIKFLLGCGLCDNNPRTTNLRCFTNDSMTYHFVPYACDSTWLITGVHELDPQRILVYPNPTTNAVQIKGVTDAVEYELYTIDGRLVKKGITIDKSIQLEQPGLHLLKIKTGDFWTVKRVLKIE